MRESKCVPDRITPIATLNQIAAEQQVPPIDDPASLVADFWEEDDLEDFLAAVQEWRA